MGVALAMLNDFSNAGKVIMRKFFKYLALVAGVFFVAYYGSLFLEGISGPAQPAGAAKFEQASLDLDAIVDRHWAREDALATEDELTAYKSLIEELGKFDYASLEKQLVRVKAQEAPARERFDARMRRMYDTYLSLAPVVGEEPARLVAQVLNGPSIFAAQSNEFRVRRFVYTSSGILHLRSRARYHLAMAHALRGEDGAAIEQLKLVLKETPDFGLINATYIIGGRVHAEKDPDFLAALNAAGGSSERFLKDYVNDGSPNLFYPFAGNRLYHPR